MTQVTGRCLCGKVSYKATLESAVGACHCGMCRRWSGGSLLAATAKDDIEIDGGEHISSYASSAWAERAFCKHCGSNLYYRLLPNPNIPVSQYHLAAGTFDDQDNVSFEQEIYVDHKPSWYQFAGEENRKRLTEAELLALYGVG